MRYVQPLQPNNTVQQSPSITKTTSTQSFRDILEQQQTLKISKHAAQRLEQRKIAIHSSDWQRITDKVLEAKSKGVQEPLVITPRATMIVSAKNMTVITAMSRQEANDQLFTNIDGTIILS